MWQKLKNCKSFGEMYGVLGYRGAQTGMYYVLSFFALVPVVMSVVYCIVRGGSTYDTLYMHEGLFTACGVLLLALSLFVLVNEKGEDNPLHDYRFSRSPWLAMLAFLLPWSIVCACFSKDRFHAFFGTDYSFDGVLSYFFYAAFFVAGLCLRDEKLRRKLLYLFSLAADVTAVIIICEGWQVPVIAEIFGNNGGNAGCFTNSNHAAYYLCTAAECLSGLVMFGGEPKTRKERTVLIAAGASLAIQLYALFVNDTLGSMLACILSIFFAMPLFYVLSGRRAKGRGIIISMIPGIILAAVIVCDIAGVPLGAGGNAGKGIAANQQTMISDVGNIVSGSEQAGRAGSGRWQVWLHYLDCFVKSPVVGLGPEGLETTYTVFLDYIRPHNEYIIYLSYLGLPGLAAYMSSLVTVCVGCFRRIKRLRPMTLAAAGAVVCYLFSAFFGNTKFYTYPYFWMLFGMLCTEAGKSRNTTTIE